MSESTSNVTIARLGEVFAGHRSFVLLSHVRPDGDAIGSQIGLGFALMAAGKSVRLLNEDGLPENLAFLPGSEAIETPPDEPLDVEVAIALDTATKPRLGDRALHAASRAKLWLNIDHHLSNPRYGDLNYVDAASPATGQIVYEILTTLGLPFPAESRDAIYTAVSTDTGSFQYPSTTAKTYEMGADLIRRGLDIGAINTAIYDSHPYRRVELMRALLNTLELCADGAVASWVLTDATRQQLDLRPEDSEGLIDIIRAIRGVRVAAFFEELPDGKIRVSMRSKDASVNVCRIAMEYGGGGHALAAGIRMPGPVSEARASVLESITRALGS